MKVPPSPQLHLHLGFHFSTNDDKRTGQDTNLSDTSPTSLTLYRGSEKEWDTSRETLEDWLRTVVVRWVRDFIVFCTRQEWTQGAASRVCTEFGSARRQALLDGWPTVSAPDQDGPTPLRSLILTVSQNHFSLRTSSSLRITSCLHVSVFTSTLAPQLGPAPRHPRSSPQHVHCAFGAFARRTKWTWTDSRSAAR